MGEMYGIILNTMTTITFQEDLKIKKTSFMNVQDFLDTFYGSVDFVYEEYLEKRLLEAKKAKKLLLYIYNLCGFLR